MKLLVPSDITLLEERFSEGTRPLTLAERIGLKLTPPMLHIRHSKNDKHDKRKVLTRSYPASGSLSEDEQNVVEILTTRQESIRKQVVRQNFLVGGTVGLTFATWYSMRHYDYKTKSILLPLMAYGGSFVGRWTGDLVTGRWSEYQRERFLGKLPPKQYYTSPSI